MRKIILTSLILLSAILTFGQKAERVSIFNYDSNNDLDFLSSCWMANIGGGVEWRYQVKELANTTLNQVPSYRAGVGRWINPYFGLRFVYNRTYIEGESSYAIAFIDENNQFNASMDIFHLDIVFNLTNYIAGNYDKDRIYELLLYAGLGASTTNGEGISYNKDYPAFGIMNVVNIAHGFGLFFEVESSPSSLDHYGLTEGAYRHNRVWPLTLSAGLTYKFGFPSLHKTGMDPIILPDPVVSTIQEAPTVSDTVEVVKVNTVVVDNVVIPPLKVLFTLDSYELSNFARLDLKEWADIVNKLAPEKRYSVTGFADMYTGSVPHNIVLSRNRSQVVFNALVDEFGVNPDQLVTDFKGGVDNMFYDDPRLSRIVLVEEIVDEQPEAEQAE